MGLRVQETIQFPSTRQMYQAESISIE
jgi:hypothetical protein